MIRIKHANMAYLKIELTLNNKYILFLLVKQRRCCLFCWCLKSARTRVLVPATSPCNKSQQVSSFELVIFASKSSRSDQLCSLRLVPRIQTSLNFLGKSLRLVPRNASCERFMELVPATRPVSSCKLFRGLVAGTIRRD